MSRGWVADLASIEVFRRDFIPFLEKEAISVAERAMVNADAGDSDYVAKLQGEYQAYINLINLFDIEGVE